MGALREIYGRVLPLIWAVPVIAALPFAAELLQHAVEIRLGMYATGRLGPDAERIRTIVGALKVLCLLVTVLLALRWWAFEGDLRRAARPNRALVKGFGLYLIVQVGGDAIALALGFLVVRLLGPAAAQGARIAAAFAPLLLWLFLTTLLMLWFVGLLTEDRSMTLRRSAGGIRGRMWSTFGLFLSAYLPAMAIHYALAYGAIGRPEAVVWTLMIVDAGVVLLLALLLPSALFTIYRRAAERLADEGTAAPLAA